MASEAYQLPHPARIDSRGPRGVIHRLGISRGRPPEQLSCAVAWLLKIRLPTVPAREIRLAWERQRRANLIATKLRVPEAQVTRDADPPTSCTLAETPRSEGVSPPGGRTRS